MGGTSVERHEEESQGMLGKGAYHQEVEHEDVRLEPPAFLLGLLAESDLDRGARLIVVSHCRQFLRTEGSK